MSTVYPSKDVSEKMCTKWNDEYYSQNSMARTSLGPWKFYHGIVPATEGLIIPLGQEAYGNNLECLFDLV